MLDQPQAILHRQEAPLLKTPLAFVKGRHQLLTRLLLDLVHEVQVAKELVTDSLTCIEIRGVEPVNLARMRRGAKVQDHVLVWDLEV